MEDRKYLARMMSSMVVLARDEELKHAGDNEECSIRYYFGRKPKIFNGITKKTAFYEERPLYSVINDRLEKTCDIALSDMEKFSLDTDTRTSLYFALMDLERKEYKDAFMCCQRAVKNCELMMRYEPGLSYDIKDGLQFAKELASEAAFYMENPKTAELRLEMEKAVSQGRSEDAKKLKIKIEEA